MGKCVMCENEPKAGKKNVFELLLFRKIALKNQNFISRTDLWLSWIKIFIVIQTK